MLTPKEIVDKMMEGDRMSQWLGITISSYDKGNVICQMTVREEMVNGFQIAHGGITYSLADSALAFSINSFGKKAVSVETSISHTQPVQINDLLITQTRVLSQTNKIAVLSTEVKNQHQELVAAFKGTVYLTGKIWE